MKHTAAAGYGGLLDAVGFVLLGLILAGCTAPLETPLDAAPAVTGRSAQAPPGRAGDRMRMVEQQLLARVEALVGPGRITSVTARVAPRNTP